MLQVLKQDGSIYDLKSNHQIVIDFDDPEKVHVRVLRAGFIDESYRATSAFNALRIAKATIDLLAATK